MIETLTLKEVAKALKYRDTRAAVKWLTLHGVTIHSMERSNRRYIFRIIFQQAQLHEFIKVLKIKFGNDWIEAYQAYASQNIVHVLQWEDTIQLRAQHSENNQSNNIKNIGSQYGHQNMWSYTPRPMDKQSPLYVPPEKKEKGLNVVVYCYKCATNCYETCRETKGPIQQTCPFGDRHVFKVYLTKPDGSRITKKLETRDITTAISLAKELKKEIEASTVEKPKAIPLKEETKKEGIKEPPLFEEVLDAFYSWMSGTDVPEQFRKERSIGYLKELKRSSDMLRNSLLEGGYDLTKLRMSQVDADLVGVAFKFLKDKGIKNRMFNKHLGVYTAVLNFYRQEYDPTFKNHFEKVPRKRIIHNPKAISREEYEQLLSVIKPENAIEIYKTGEARNHYKSYTKDAIRLAAETGLRRESLLSLRYSDIDYANKYVKVANHKVNSIEGRSTNEEKIYIYVPLTQSLRALIDELREKNNGKESGYLIAPEHVSAGRITTLSNDLSRAFGHFFKQIDSDRKLSFKSIRKRYITDMSIFMGGNAKTITGHSGNEILERNYIDKSAIAKAASGFQPFAEVPERQQELEQVRNNSITNSKNQTIEK